MAELPPHSSPLFDPARIPDFIEPADRRNLLQLFLDSSRETLKKLKQGLNTPQKDITALKHILHGLKGAAVSVGAVGVAQIAKSMELGLASWPDDEVQKALHRLEQTLSDTQIAMNPWLM